MHTGKIQTFSKPKNDTTVEHFRRNDKSTIIQSLLQDAYNTFQHLSNYSRMPCKFFCPFKIITNFNM
jgi:hypothetical protein